MSTNLSDRLDRSHAALLVVDLQEKLLPSVQNADACVQAAVKMISAAKILGVPVFGVEQCPAGLGKTDGRIASLLPHRPVEKMQFSAWTPEVERLIGERFHIVLVGIEAHVCMQLTALDLIRAGKRVWVCADATTSRRAMDCEVGLDRMRQAGAAVTTVESAIFELLGEAGTTDFRQILKIVK